MLSFSMLHILLRLPPEYTWTLNTFTCTTFLLCKWWMSGPLLPMTLLHFPKGKWPMRSLLLSHWTYLSLITIGISLFIKGELQHYFSLLFPCHTVILPHLSDSVYGLLNCDRARSSMRLYTTPFKSFLNADCCHAYQSCQPGRNSGVFLPPLECWLWGQEIYSCPKVNAAENKQLQKVQLLQNCSNKHLPIKVILETYL